jgi:SAM-dependent methyltransferase/ribosomal protein S18 acetylase RimI-like enzyme
MVSKDPPPPSLLIKEISPSDSAELEEAAALHMELLSFGPMAGLGRRFIRDVCYRMLMEEELLRTAIAYVDGQTAGLVAYTSRSADFHRRGLAAHPFRAAIAALVAVVFSPRRLLALLRGLRVLASRRGDSRRIDDETGEIVCIAVRPKYLVPRFVRLTGIGFSEELVRWGVRYLRRAGCRHVRMLVDEGNKRALLFYHRLGAQFKSATLGGEPQLEVWFDLMNSGLEKEHAPPLSWLEVDEAAAVLKRGWGFYWETIEDRQRFFAAEARDYADRLRTHIGLHGRQIVLDFGCGFGWVAAEIAADVARVDIWDGAASVRRRALTRTAHVENVHPIDLPAMEDQLRGRYDLILVHSVVQYMSADELSSWLARWRLMLAPGGVLVLSDLVQPHGHFLRDLLRYLRFGLRSGFLIDQLIGGIRGFVRYFGTRTSVPLLAVVPETVHELAASVGLTACPLEQNLSYRNSRRTMLLRAVP